jgi:hypothetical protein
MIFSRACPHTAPRTAVFHLRGEAGVAVFCWRCAIRYPPMLRRSARVAIVVGTLLALINHGDHLLQGRVTAVTALKIALTYTVPFAVATWSALVNSRIRQE